MTLRGLLDDTILRLGLCDRVDVLACRKFLDGIEAQRAMLQAQSLADQLEPERCCASSHDPADTACRGFERGANGRCVFCDHDASCHPGPGATCEIGSGEGPFSPECHLTPAGGAAPYESIEIVREGAEAP